MNRKLWGGLAAAALLGVACSAASPAEKIAADYQAAPAAYAREMARAEAKNAVAGFNPGTAGEGGFGAPLPAGALEKTRKLVRRANLRLRVAEAGAAEQPLMAALDKHGAYASSASISEHSRSYTIRVPAASWEALLEELKGLGRVLYRHESAEDVTLNYYDLEGRLSTKQELLKTYRSYLGKAENIEEIMTVEARIAELQQEIDWTGTELRSLADLVDYATIELNLEAPPSAASSARPGLGERVGELFSGFGEAVSTALVILLGFVVYGIPGILLVILLFWVLFGRIGLVKKLWRLAAGKEPA